VGQQLVTHHHIKGTRVALWVCERGGGGGKGMQIMYWLVGD